MNFDVFLPWISVIIAAVGLVTTNVRSNKASRDSQRKSDLERALQQEKILSSIDTLASKDFLDQRLKEELEKVGFDVKTQITSLKTDMKYQITDLKKDIKDQQDVTKRMTEDVVRAVESANYANQRVTSLDKRIDDLRTILFSSNKKGLD